MAAGPIGSCWATDSWADTAWEADSWAAGTDAPVALGDLTTLFADYVQGLRDASALLALDSTSLVAEDVDTVRAATPGEVDDFPTMYARYLS